MTQSNEKGIIKKNSMMAEKGFYDGWERVLWLTKDRSVEKVLVYRNNIRPFWSS